MDELEQKLKQARLSAPSDELDQRIANACEAALRRHEAPSKAPFWWWLAALATAGCIAALFLLPAQRSLPAPAAVVYQVEAQGRMLDMLLNRPALSSGAPQFVFQIKTQ